MTRVKFDVGAEADILSPGEHAGIMRMTFANWEAEKLRGVKHMRMPMLQGTAVNGSLIIDPPQPIGPREGFAWSIRRLVAFGLTTASGSATPDIINLYFNHATGAVPAWQLNGNNFGYTFGRLELTMYGGDKLIVNSLGTFQATGTITIGGELIECPAEMLAKIA